MSRSLSVEIPYAYDPRPYQTPAFRALRRGIRRAILVWHRRAGKDKTALNWTIEASLRRKGIYYYFFPKFNQGRRVIWEGLDFTGFRLRDHFHPSIVATRRDGTPDMDETEMRVRLENGSLFQIVGTDNVEIVRGPNPVGCVFSEYSYQDPEGWEIVAPILGENRGWALFVFTPNGQNHAYTLYQAALDAPKEWYAQKLTVDDTRVISPEFLASERRRGVPEEFIQQEYYCSFESALVGAYYGRLLDQARNEGRIGMFPWEPSLPVYTGWDLGVGDTNVIWFVQALGQEIRWIDCYAATGQGLTTYLKVIREKPYIYARDGHYAPFDIMARDYGTGRSRWDLAAEHGIHFVTVPKHAPEERIDAVRRQFHRFYFNREPCARGLLALSGYKAEWNADRKMYGSKPYHDWTSDYADALGYFCMGWLPVPTERAPEYALTEYNVFTRARTMDMGSEQTTAIRWR